MNPNCFHCGLPIPSSSSFSTHLLGEKRDFCCIGCLSIAETLSNNGLDSFYKFRDGDNKKARELIPSELESIDAYDALDVLNQISQSTDEPEESGAQSGIRSIELGIEGITCAACGWLIKQTIGKIDSVISISVNVTTQRALLKWSTNKRYKNKLSDIIKAFNKIGYRAYPFSEDERIEIFEKTNRQFIKRLAIASIGMMQVMTYALAVYLGDYQDIEASYRQFFLWLSFLVATPVVFYSARPFFESAWNNLKAKRLGMNFPVSLAILSAYFSSTYSLLAGKNSFYFDSVVMFTFFLLIGRFLEHRARYFSVLKQTNFQQLIPLSVKKITTDEELNETFKNILVINVVAGDKLIIPAGGIIPVDGTLLENPADINEAVMTGEFLPISKQPNDALISGSTNQSAALTMLVSKDFTHSKINQLIDLQREAENLKPDSVSIADKISHWYVIALLLVLLLTSAIWWFNDASRIFDIALSILVVSCPCALSLATPAALAAATSQLTDLGFLIRNSSTLSELSRVSHIFFDKTGTLTEGRISIEKVLNYSDYTETQLLRISSQLEEISSHPIADAFKNIPDIELLPDDKINITNKQEIIGQGVIANLNENRYLLGKAEFLIADDKDVFELNYLYRKQHQQEVAELEQNFLQHNKKYKGMAVFLSENGKLIAIFQLKDQVKPTAMESIQALRKSCQITMLTGDTQQAATQVGKELCIDDVMADAPPEEKLQAINAAQKRGQSVMMVGDGFNDLGALGSANVSISLAGSSHLSKTKSDALLVSEDLTVIPKAISIANKVQIIIKQNLAWAIAYNLLAIPFAAMGFIPAWLAAIGMSLSSLVVVLNALRLRN
ncbi:MAG: heavy metal translocating P-type ATPase [Kangiellaceae bacterium]|nr:heavy metal translocating P-type ATPase [Kangiellaceae bacterium]